MQLVPPPPPQPFLRTPPPRLPLHRGHQRRARQLVLPHHGAAIAAGYPEDLQPEPGSRYRVHGERDDARRVQRPARHRAARQHGARQGFTIRYDRRGGEGKEPRLCCSLFVIVTAASPPPFTAPHCTLPLARHTRVTLRVSLRRKL